VLSGNSGSERSVGDADMVRVLGSWCDHPMNCGSRLHQRLADPKVFKQISWLGFLSQGSSPVANFLGRRAAARRAIYQP
jgi:hypothetical protein